MDYINVVLLYLQEIDKLEVIGFCKPFCTETHSNATLEITNKEEEPKDLHEYKMSLWHCTLNEI